MKEKEDIALAFIDVMKFVSLDFNKFGFVREVSGKYTCSGVRWRRCPRCFARKGIQTD